MKALYYPHTEIVSEPILKSALLLWDEIQTIYPSHGLADPITALPHALHEARELVVTHAAPTSEQKHLAQEQLSALLRTGVLHRICSAPPVATQSRRPNSPYGDRSIYRIFNQKFLDETWWMLQDQGFATWSHGNRDAAVPANLGFLMMSLLADACAGSQIDKVTDRPEAYSWLEEVRANEVGSEVVKNLSPDQVGPAYDRLISISLKAIGAEQIPIESLLALRQREVRQGGNDFAALRRRYHQTLL